jgi:hypothetical protein
MAGDAICGSRAAWGGHRHFSRDLGAAMKRMVLRSRWAARRMKAVRLALVNLAGPSPQPCPPVRHLRQTAAMATIVQVRQTIRRLAPAPIGYPPN